MCQVNHSQKFIHLHFLRRACLCLKPGSGDQMVSRSKGPRWTWSIGRASHVRRLQTWPNDLQPVKTTLSCKCNYLLRAGRIWQKYWETLSNAANMSHMVIAGTSMSCEQELKTPQPPWLFGRNTDWWQHQMSTVLSIQLLCAFLPMLIYAEFGRLFGRGAPEAKFLSFGDGDGK